jgi:hypothetical protein
MLYSESASGMKLVGAGDYALDDGKIDTALRFVLGLGSVDMIIVGSEHDEQIDDYTARVRQALSQTRSG